MRILRSVTIAGMCLLSATFVLPGCSRRQNSSNAEAADAPKNEGDKVVFSTGSAQLSYLTIETAGEQRAIAAALTGRLAWDDDVTARVFPPVSGRIMSSVANPGQHVSMGDVLAQIKSPDFGQAQADARKAAA